MQALQSNDDILFLFCAVPQLNIDISGCFISMYLHALVWFGLIVILFPPAPPKKSQHSQVSLKQQIVDAFSLPQSLSPSVAAAFSGLLLRSVDFTGSLKDISLIVQSL